MVQIIRALYKIVIISSLAFMANLYSDESVEEIVVKGKVLYSDQVQ